MRPKLLALATLFAVFSAFTAQAVPIKIAYGPIETQAANSGDQAMVDWATAAIAAFNAHPYEGAPLPELGSLAFKVSQDGVEFGVVPAGWPSGFADDLASITLPLGGYDYIILSWGGSRLPVGNGNAEYLYYIGGSIGDYTFNRPEGARGGLSHYNVYGARSVPDSGATVGLLGLGLIGFALLRRRIAR